ncbi:glucosyl-dolichyl phosphate glucuronosyltransferase [Halorubrum sp. SD626R]|uniref:glucosyl-dolichyl phosphate glucuronosyltransferase n=1 Tax=Halorubrum sp. SD626R TaxID=1419722 RepID=UPI000ABCA7E7|nr:glucosyl-dolichyl phosphate glucuronosyltransferase [Halorubrum sp. SD626R]TKX82251.1 glycosyltransferase family 2 protein [Halorubrum sp. SD626R]
MKVSVVIATYSMDRFEDFCDAVDSVLAQTYSPVELVLVVDGDEMVYERTLEAYGSRDNVVIHCNNENRGLSYSRTQGVKQASGDIVALFDDDAVAEPDWIEELVSTYRSTDAIAVGGKMIPEWVVGKPWFLPPEFYWLVGVTPPRFAAPGEEVRNTYGSNISFRAEVFDRIGEFNEDIGPQAGKVLQGGETEFCARMREDFGQGVIYNPGARVSHKVFEYRTDPWWLLVRSFWQGYSKRVMEGVIEDSGDNETLFLKRLLTHSIPNHLTEGLRGRSLKPLGQLFYLVLFTMAVGFGYLYGIARHGLNE